MWVGRTVGAMDGASSPQGWVYGVSCQSTPARHPTQCQLLLLLLLLLLPASGRHYRDDVRPQPGVRYCPAEMNCEKRSHHTTTVV